MGTQENIGLVHRAVEEFFNKGNLDAADELFTTDYVWHPADGISPPIGRDAHKQDYSLLRAAFPDIELHVDDTVARGDKVVTRFTITGTHTATFQLADGQQVTATNRPLKWTGMTIHRIVDGKIKEGWINYDKAGMDRQLGLDIKPPANQVAAALAG